MKIQNSKFATPQALKSLLLSESADDLEALPSTNPTGAKQ